MLTLINWVEVSPDTNAFLTGNDTYTELAASRIEIDEVRIGIVFASFELLQLNWYSSRYIQQTIVFILHINFGTYPE